MSSRDFMLKGAKNLNISLSPLQIQQLLEYKDYMLEINQSMNLTNITEENEFIIKHYFDSFTIDNAYDFNKVHSVLDMGSGAGLPGIPLKILYPNISFVLVDSLNKRIGFLNNVVDKLNLENIDCIHARAEDLGQNPQYRGKFDVVTSRAVANLAVLSEYCLPLVALNGVFLCLKGPKYKEELEESQGAIETLGGKVEEVKTIQLPFSDITHYILIIRKVKQTPTKFPRKAGKPTKKPIK